MHLQPAERQLTIKLVYYGPGLSGKTTNLQALHERLVPESRNRLVTLKTADERTLFFDLLPLRIGTAESGLFVRVKLFTVPGQPIHTAARRLVVRGADGIGFIADSRLSRIQANAESFRELLDNLEANDIAIHGLPLVIQFNKRDLPDVRDDDELHALALRTREPVFSAIASQGIGVAETFMALFRLTFEHLSAEHDLVESYAVDGPAVVQALATQLGIAATDAQLNRYRYGDLGAVAGEAGS